MKNLEWDDSKRVSNFKKHGIDFLEAAKVFSDPNRKEETRFQTIGILDQDVIIVVHTVRKEKKRIISARRANKNERHYYYEHGANYAIKRKNRLGKS
jgi:uncharacterized DUF497 family protein